MGFSSGGSNWPFDLLKKWYLFVVFLLIARVCHGHMGDSCDWTGSGLSSHASSSSKSDSHQGVQPLYLRCRQGRIRWSYPSGALRLVLRLQGSGEKDFRACIRPGPEFQSVRIYLEGHRRLLLLYATDTPQESNNDVTEHVNSKKMRCFASVRGQAALFVEAIPTGILGSLKKTVAEFAYDLEPMRKDALANELEECRPCTDDEMVQYYCSSDYVIRGTVTTLTHQPSQDRSELEVRVVQVYRDSPTKPVLWSRHDPDDSFTRRAILHRPLKCETKVGSGEFLFMGRRLLGDPYVTCAPRLGQWKAIRRKAIQDGSSPCLLD